MSMQNRERTLSRDVVAHQIPSGDKQTLSAGEMVYIHQVLGGSYTVQTGLGLFRIDGTERVVSVAAMEDQTGEDNGGGDEAPASDNAEA